MPYHVFAGLLAPLMQAESWWGKSLDRHGLLKRCTPTHLLKPICFLVIDDDKPSLLLHCCVCMGIPFQTTLNRMSTDSHPFALQSSFLTFELVQGTAICLGQCERQDPGIHVCSGQNLGLGCTSG